MNSGLSQEKGDKEVALGAKIGLGDIVINHVDWPGTWEFPRV